MKKIQKRTGELVPYDASKIVKEIMKAMRHGSGIVDIEVAQLIASKITMSLRDNWWGDMTPTISDIEAMVFHELTLMGHHQTAKAYESYRAVQQYKREKNTTDDKIGRAHV